LAPSRTNKKGLFAVANPCYNSRGPAGLDLLSRQTRFVFGDRVMSEVSVSNVEPQLVMGLRKRGTYAEIRPMIRRIHKHIEAGGARIAGPPMFICHETPKEVVKVNLQHNADVEVVVPVSARIEGDEEIACYELPGGPMAKITHQGPYERSAAAYKKLFAWIAENHKKVVGPTREVYLNDPRKVPPEELLTEIYAPVM
jgi:AraC family transcriptional regulator